MYLRYYSLPSHGEGTNSIGTVKRDLQELNDKFGTNFKNASNILKGIERGIKEILFLTGEEIFCSYDRLHGKFIFSWKRNSTKIESKCKIPNSRVEEFMDWIIKHSKQKIQNTKAYKIQIKKLILNNELDELDNLYRGMMIHKYGFTSDEIDEYKSESGKYKEFYGKKEKGSLF